jgi:hypothetical protein
VYFNVGAELSAVIISSSAKIMHRHEQLLFSLSEPHSTGCVRRVNLIEGKQKATAHTLTHSLSGAQERDTLMAIENK